MDKNLDKINKFFPRDTFRRRAAKGVFNAFNRLKKNPKGICALELEQVSYVDGKLFIAGAIVIDNNIKTNGLFKNGAFVCEITDWLPRPDLKDKYFFTSELIVAGFSINANSIEILPADGLELRIETDRGLFYSFNIDINSKTINKKAGAPGDYGILLKKLSAKNESFRKYVEIANLETRYPFILLLLEALGDSSRPILMIDHGLGGGANFFRDERIKELASNGDKIILLVYNYSGDSYDLKYFYKNVQAQYFGNKFPPVKKFLSLIPFKEIFINSLVSFRERLLVQTFLVDLKKSNQCVLKVAAHDYFMACPSYNLLNYEYLYCGIPLLEECSLCMKKLKHEEVYDKNANIERWRKDWLEIMNEASEILCFSHASSDILKKAFPSPPVRKFKVSPHKIREIKPVITAEKNKDTINIGIPGRIHYPKGSGIIESMLKFIKKNKIDNINIIVIGELADKKIDSPFLRVTGKYDRLKLSDIIIENEIDIIFIPSIWPETFSYTCEEAIKMRLPVAAFNLGAPAERLKKYEKGIIISEINPETAIIEIIQFVRKLNE